MWSCALFASKRFLIVAASAASLAGLIALSGQAHALDVDETDDASALVDALLGPGIELVPGTVSYTGDSRAAGLFSGGDESGLGIESGVILSTGRAGEAVGPNQNVPDGDGPSDDTSSDFDGDGHEDLDELVEPNATRDAVALEFSFESAGGDLFFRFVFASEEYNEFVDRGFDDVFGFFVNGENIGVVPATSQRVSVNTVNCGTTGIGSGPNCFFFNNNGEGSFDIAYDGFTDVFIAEARNLPPGPNTISLIIADTSDSIVDSAVFLEGGSFLPVMSGLSKELTSGPDLDQDEEIDLAVEVGQATATTYDFTIAYGPDVETPFAIILDTVPAEWQVTEVNGLIPDDGCIAGDDGNGGAGTVEVEPVDGDCDDEGEPTRITWLPDPGVGTSTLNVVLETRGGFGGPFLPAACGPLRLNEGAAAFEVNEFNEVVVDAGGEPVVVFGPTSPLTLVAVEDLDGGGIVPDGSGDEDGDGRTDADEALNAGTDPCDAGPSFEMCWSRPCPPRP